MKYPKGIEFWSNRMYSPMYKNSIEGDLLDKFGKELEDGFNAKLSEIEVIVGGKFDEKCKYNEKFKYLKFPTLKQVSVDGFENIEIRIDINPCNSQTTSTKLFVIPQYKSEIDSTNIGKFIETSKKISEKIMEKICTDYFEFLRTTQINEIKKDVHTRTPSYRLTAGVIGSDDMEKEDIKNDLKILCDYSPKNIDLKECRWFKQTVTYENKTTDSGIFTFVGTNDEGYFIGIATDPHVVLSSVMLDVIPST